MKMFHFANRCVKEILRDPINLFSVLVSLWSCWRC